MIRAFRKVEYREGRWRNGLGTSWDIVSDPPGADMDDFDWRFAIARIEGDVPFSAYPGVDRVFTLIDGDGLTLEVEGSPPMAVDRCHVPHAFPGDARTSCRLHGGTCRALNLFLKRGVWRAGVRIVREPIPGEGPSLVFALSGDTLVNGHGLEEGDAALAEDRFMLEPGANAVTYLAKLSAW